MSFLSSLPLSSCSWVSNQWYGGSRLEAEVVELDESYTRAGQGLSGFHKTVYNCPGCFKDSGKIWQLDWCETSCAQFIESSVYTMETALTSFFKNLFSMFVMKQKTSWSVCWNYTMTTQPTWPMTRSPQLGRIWRDEELMLTLCWWDWNTCNVINTDD